MYAQCMHMCIVFLWICAHMCVCESRCVREKEREKGRGRSRREERKELQREEGGRRRERANQRLMLAALSCSPPYSLGKHLSLDMERINLIQYTAWPASLRDPPIPSSVLGSQACAVVQSFYVGFEDLNSCLHDFFSLWFLRQDFTL